MIELLRQRRSIRQYTPQPVSRQSLDILTEALLRSPTSRNRKPWSFIVVDNPGLLAQLSAAKPHGSEFLKAAPLGIVIVADSTKSDVWVEDTAIAAILLQVTATSLGLGSCWIQIRNRPHEDTITAEEWIQKLLGLQDHIKVASIVSIGHPAETPPPIPATDLDRHKVKRNHFSQPL
jgi:nitroreductase